jgi:hypothetical protein
VGLYLLCFMPHHHSDVFSTRFTNTSDDRIDDGNPEDLMENLGEFGLHPRTMPCSQDDSRELRIH